MGMNQIDKDIANHYLNIFASHSKRQIKASLHKAAIDSFKLALFYSALTGANQLRSGGQAQLFAVYDKAPTGLDVVKFFDTYSLIEEASKQINKAIHVSPIVEHISLKNKKITKKGNTLEKNISLRLTDLLIDARSYEISVSIAKNFLQSVYKGKI